MAKAGQKIKVKIKHSARKEFHCLVVTGKEMLTQTYYLHL